METLAAGELFRVMPRAGKANAEENDQLLNREWLVTNGLGGYASGTVSGVVTRRYHGYLISALPAAFGRRMMLNDVVEQIVLPRGNIIMLGGEELASTRLRLHGAGYLEEFRLEMGLPVWRYEMEGIILEKRLLLPYRQNTVHINYRLVSSDDSTVHLELRPAVNFRPHEAPVNTPLADTYVLTVINDRYEFAEGPELPKLRMLLYGQTPMFTFNRRIIEERIYRTEESRGYEAKGNLWSPGYFQVELTKESDATLVASTESWETICSLSPDDARRTEYDRRRQLVENAVPEARRNTAAELVIAADQFIITPAGRAEDAARLHAEGGEVRTIIAGYHWFTDWGRDTMISLEGLTLVTGRHLEAGWILRTFAQYIQDGLIPNLFPEGQKRGLYHTADATLWYFHAIDRYVEITGDKGLLKNLIPRLIDIVDSHLRGTDFGIRVDPEDGLLEQGEQGYQLTWMDAKVGDWVVTPRRGKAVEINALWYNALRLLERWVTDEMGEEASRRLGDHAEKARVSFNRRFWYSEGGYLYDVVDGENGDDPSMRPNQVLSIALHYPVLDQARWKPVLEAVERRLLTPVGLRSLAPGHPDYKPQYYGDVRSRDAAYHQGTVWAWLIGPFIDAWLKLHPDDYREARRFLEGFNHHMGEACIGSISEIADAEPPFTPRGCIAQAWSVGEVLRCLVKTGA